MTDQVESAPIGPYEPDETRMEELFRRPARPTKQKAETWIAGDVFDSLPPGEAEKLRYENLHRKPVRVKQEEEK